MSEWLPIETVPRQPGLLYAPGHGLCFGGVWGPREAFVTMLNQPSGPVFHVVTHWMPLPAPPKGNPMTDLPELPPLPTPHYSASPLEAWEPLEDMWDATQVQAYARQYALLAVAAERERAAEITAEMVEAGLLVLADSGYLDRDVTPADALFVERLLTASLLRSHPRG